MNLPSIPGMIEGDRVEVGRAGAVQEVDPGLLAVVEGAVPGNGRVVILQHRQPDVDVRAGLVVDFGFGLLRDHQLEVGRGGMRIARIPGHRVVIGLVLRLVGEIMIGLVQIAQAAEVILHRGDVSEPGLVVGRSGVLQPIAGAAADPAEGIGALVEGGIVVGKRGRHKSGKAGPAVERHAELALQQPGPCEVALSQVAETPDPVMIGKGVAGAVIMRM